MKRKYIISISILLVTFLSIVLTKCNTNNDSENSNVISDDTISVVDRIDKVDISNDTGRFILNIGNKPSINSSTTVWGNKIFYNTKTYHPFSLTGVGDHPNDITEPSWFMQLQWEYKKDYYIGLHVNKEKFRSNRNDFGIAGPTDLGMSYGISFDLFGTEWMSTNISLAAGATIGRPRFETPWWEPLHGTQTIHSDKITTGGYEQIGVFSTLVTRVDFRIKKRYNLFVAFTLNYRNINDYETSVGTQITGEIYSFGINVGLGINFNYKKDNKKDNYRLKF